MSNHSEEKVQDTELKLVGLELMFLTPKKYSHSEGITTVELARLVGLPNETVRKKLAILKDIGIVRVRGNNPKCWLFDEYQYQRLDEDNEIYKLFTDLDDVDFDKYFDYSR